MDPHHSDNMTSMNLNMYPSTEGHVFPEGAQRIWSHTDYEALTLLFQKPGNSQISWQYQWFELLSIVVLCGLLLVWSHTNYEALTMLFHQPGNLNLLLQIQGAMMQSNIHTFRTVQKPGESCLES